MRFYRWGADILLLALIVSAFAFLSAGDQLLSFYLACMVVAMSSTRMGRIVFSKLSFPDWVFFLGAVVCVTCALASGLIFLKNIFTGYKVQMLWGTFSLTLGVTSVVLYMCFLMKVKKMAFSKPSVITRAVFPGAVACMIFSLLLHPIGFCPWEIARIYQVEIDVQAKDLDGENVLIIITHLGGDTIRNIMVTAENADGKWIYPMEWSGEFSTGESVTFKYAYGPNPAGKTTTIKVNFGPFTTFVEEVRIE